MNRRNLVAHAAILPLLPLVWPSLSAPASSAETVSGSTTRRVRPSDPDWPSAASWEKLKQAVGGRLIRVEPLFASCGNGAAASCAVVLAALKNPYYVGDQPAGTQTVGWVDAWTSAPSAYAVTARTAEDVAAAVNFARANKLRLVVKGGGHSYQGTSDSADSLLIWTRAMNDIVLHDAFVAQGCAGNAAPQPAVTLGAGVVWMHAYDAVTTKAHRYVQGGGCATVGVAGLIQSGGFGSFSRNYGTAAGGLLEAEVVTADGQIRIANACTNPDLFWGIKGGGGGSLGVVTKITLRTRELPALFGGVRMNIKATSDAAFRRVIARFAEFCVESLLNRRWGETVTFGADNTVAVTMVCQGLDEVQVGSTWKSLTDWVAASPDDFTVIAPLAIKTSAAYNWWNAEYLRTNTLHGQGFFDPRPGAPANNVWFAEENTELGIFLHGFQSLWLPASLLEENQRDSFADALFAATRHWDVQLHFNKGLAGTAEEDVAAARDTAMNPAALTAFALALIVGSVAPAYKNLLTGPPDLSAARHDATAIAAAGDELRKVVPDAGSYVSESDFFERNWQNAFWGENYARLREVKRNYDPDGLFFVHHGVGSEEWSADGFTRLI
jgi:FAD/FMN-containing dehydrogenase